MINVETAKTAELVAFYNAHAETPVKKFTDRKTAERRVQKLIETMEPEMSEQAENLDSREEQEDEQLKAEYGYTRCPHCEVHLSNGVDLDEKTGQGICLGCGERFGKAKAKNEKRSEGVAKSWQDPEIKAKRSQRNKVLVDGVEYKSVTQAFKALDLPLKAHVKFRGELKAAGKLEAYDRTWEIVE